MSNELPYEKMLQQCLRSELRLVNAGLPRNQKSLSGLLREEYPHVMCSDGSTHFFKRRELEYLSSMIDTDDQEALLLPMIIELEGNQAEASLICQGEVEEKVTSGVLNMPVTCEQGRVRIYRPQLALLRKMLKTTTQYVFSPKIMA